MIIIDVELKDRNRLMDFFHNLNYGREHVKFSNLIKNGAKVAEVPVIMDERKVGTSYLNLIGSAKYMIRMMTSILIFQNFRIFH